MWKNQAHSLSFIELHLSEGISQLLSHLFYTGNSLVNTLKCTQIENQFTNVYKLNMEILLVLYAIYQLFIILLQ